MSCVLLDTCAVSALFRGHEGIRATVQSSRRIAISPITLAELQAGFLGGNQRAENQEALLELIKSPRTRALIIDPQTASRYAQVYEFLRQTGRLIPTNDIWIVASAMQFGLRVVTTDKHFERVPQITLELHES